MKYMPELLELSGEDMVIEMPPPTAINVSQRVHSTVVQIGGLIAVLIAIGSIARERDSGTAAMVLSKPVGREAFILAKLTAMSTSFIVALVPASAACFGYTVMLIEGADGAAFLLQNLLIVLFLIFSLSLTLLFSSMFRSQLAAGGLAL
jgi:ABC-2 type transport system permease protein